MQISRINNISYQSAVNTTRSAVDKSNVSFKGLGEGALAQKLAKSNGVKKLLLASNKNTLAIEALYALLITCMLRPAVTLLTPSKSQEDKEKNRFRAAHAIASGALGFVFTMCVSHPMSDAVDKVMNTKLADGSLKYIKKYAGQLTENGGKPFKELAKRIHQPVFMPLRAMATVAIVPPILALFGLKKNKHTEQPKVIEAPPQAPSFSSLSLPSSKLQVVSNSVKGGN